MSAIYEEIVLAWDGREYTAQPDYRMVQRIEASPPAGLGISIVRLITEIETPQPPVSQVADVVSLLLQSGGATTAKPEDVFAHLMRHATAEEWATIRQALARAFIPQERRSGNSAAPAGGADSTDASSPQ